MDPAAAVCAADLGKRYAGGAEAVASLDLAVGFGEVFGLLGPNGAGKTTTVGMLTTRVRPTRGRALIGGIDVVKQAAKAKRAIGVVSQTNTLDRALSARENLVAHGWYFGFSDRQARRAAERLLALFSLGEWADRRVSALSGGIAQRLMIARAILHRPAVLFLDEPTAGLDPASRISLRAVLQALRASGQTIFLTTHDMEEADQLCDRVAIMDHGRILALDTPERLKQSHGGAIELRLAAASGLDELLAVLGRRLASAIAGPPHRRGGTATLALRSEDGVVGEVLAAAEETPAVALSDVSLARPTLERVFLNLTGRGLRE
jgi:ABC-2 type transport system ATP-binding protein